MTSDVTAIVRAALFAYSLTAEGAGEAKSTASSESEAERFSLPAFALAVANDDPLSEEPDTAD